MKKLIRQLAGSTLLLLSLTVISCNKSKESEDFAPGVYFKLNGKQVTLTKYPRAAHNIFQGRHSLDFGAVLTESNDPTAEGASITVLSDQDDFAAGKTYTDTATTQVGLGTFNYLPANAPSGEDYWTTFVGAADKKNFTIKITERTATYLKGTFSGNVFKYDDETKMAKVTEGKFYVMFE